MRPSATRLARATLRSLSEEVFMRCAILCSAFRLATLILACSCARANAQDQLPAEMQHKIDKVATDALAKTGLPSASVAVVKDGQIAYLHAYGNARLDTATPAKPEMRFSIGSISKQFTAAGILLLQEQGKLSLDDKVGKFLPGLTRANEVTIRQLLSHTSGYQDFWPQDYVMPNMLKPTTPQAIADQWAKKPLDFEPGSRWQYSNTNYTLAGMVVEKASGMPFFQFVRTRILQPAGLTSAADFDVSPRAANATGYIRYGLGPLRPAPDAGSGWMWAAGELAMAASDLAKWDINLIRRALLASNASFYFRDQALKDFQSSLGPLGAATSFVQTRTALRGGMTYRSYRVTFPNRALRVWTYEMPDGKLEQYQVAPTG